MIIDVKKINNNKQSKICKNNLDCLQIDIYYLLSQILFYQVLYYLIIYLKAYQQTYMIHNKTINLAQTGDYELYAIIQNYPNRIQLTIQLYQIYNKLRVKKYSKIIQQQQISLLNINNEQSLLQILKDKQKYLIEIQKGNIVIMMNDQQTKIIELDQKPNDLYQLINQIQIVNQRISRIQNMNQLNPTSQLIKSKSSQKSKIVVTGCLFILIVIAIVLFNTSQITQIIYNDNISGTINNRRFLNQEIQNNNITFKSNFITQKALDGIIKVTSSLRDKLQALEQTDKSNNAIMSSLKDAIQNHRSQSTNLKDIIQRHELQIIELISLNDQKINQINQIKLEFQSLKNVTVNQISKIKLRIQSQESIPNSLQQSPSLQVVSMADPQSKHYYLFAIEDLYIELLSTKAQPLAQLSPQFSLLGRYSIKQKPINTFKIIKTKTSQITFGIVDRKNNNPIRTIFQQYYLQYNAFNGFLFASLLWIDGPKSVQGDVIVMQVSADTITWRVNSQVIHSYTSQIISDDSINWVPFVGMRETGDIVSWY